jgi:hypothetical protein
MNGTGAYPILPMNWRIVAQVSKPAVSRASKPASRPQSEGLSIWKSALQSLVQRFNSLLWPHPLAWGGLAAIWIFIFAAHVLMEDKTPAMAEKTLPPSPEMLAELRQQERMLAELIGPTDLNADRSKTLAPQPRSQSMEIMSA